MLEILARPATPDYQIHEESALTPELAQFLSNVTWGTKGALYQLPECHSMLSHLPSPHFLTLRSAGRLMAVRMVLQKRPWFGRERLNCVYHSFFSVRPEEKGRGYGRHLAEATLKRLGPRLKERGIIYSHVETDNERSLRIHEALGYQRLGSFYSVTFNRLTPRGSREVQLLEESEQPRIVQQLEDQYAAHALLDFDESLRPSAYFVFKERGSIMAGLQAEPQRWTIQHLGGFGGAAAVRVLPRFPVLRDVFNPADFRFLKVSNVFFHPGYAAAVFRLLENVLAAFELKTALMFWDHSSPVYQRLAIAGRWGFLNALTATRVEVLGHFQGFSESERDEFCRRPKVISPTDL